MEQGVVADPVEAKHVFGSVMPLTVAFTEVNARRSARPAGTGNDVMSMMRKRNRVTAAPVLFVMRRLKATVPLFVFGGAESVKSRKRFGSIAAALVASSNTAVNGLLRTIGLVRFSGPGAPSRCEPVTSANRKSVALLFVSTGVVLGQTPSTEGLAPLPQTSRSKLYCNVLPLTAGRFVPSRNRSQMPPPVLVPKPTASSRV